MSISPEKYRKNVAIIILHKGKILFCRRKSSYYLEEAWQLPQGGVEEGEEFEDAVHREIEEETGMTGAKILGRTKDYFYYEWPKEVPRTRITNNFIGQKQIYFVTEVEELSLSQLKESEEFDAFEWVSIETILNKIVSFKKPIYERAFEELKHLISIND